MQRRQSGWFGTTRAHSETPCKRLRRPVKGRKARIGSALSESLAARGIVHQVSRLERITSDPNVCHGQPTVRGLRYTVESLLELLSAGMTIDEVLADYPELERDDILAALEFGARTAGGRVVPLTAA